MARPRNGFRGLEESCDSKRRRLPMKVCPERSKAPAPVVQLIAAIVSIAGTPEKLLEMATSLWPQLEFYRGHTHLRLMLTGKAEGDSVYVELVEQVS